MMTAAEPESLRAFTYEDFAEAVKARTLSVGEFVYNKGTCTLVMTSDRPVSEQTYKQIESLLEYATPHHKTGNLIHINARYAYKSPLLYSIIVA